MGYLKKLSHQLRIEQHDGVMLKSDVNAEQNDQNDVNNNLSASAGEQTGSSANRNYTILGGINDSPFLSNKNKRRYEKALVTLETIEEPPMTPYELSQELPLPAETSTPKVKVSKTDKFKRLFSKSPRNTKDTN